MKIELIIFLIILSSLTSGCIKPANLTNESGNLKSISDSRPSELRSQHSNLVIIHQPQLKKNELIPIRVNELHINGEVRYEGNTTLTYFNIKVQFYDKKGTIVCEKTSDGWWWFSHDQSFDLKVTDKDCPGNWGLGLDLIENYIIGIEYSK